MFNFPWSNFHELNLDWILSVVKEAKEIWTQGRTDIDYAVKTADEAKEIASQAAQAQVADNSVSTPKIVDGAVTTPKIADGGVTLSKLSTSLQNELAQFSSDIGKLKNHVFLFVGDSYDGIIPNVSMFQQTATILNVPFMKAAAGGYGFIGSDNKTWLSLVQAMSTDHDSDITDLCIAGGANDSFVSDMSRIDTAIVNFDTYVRGRFPNLQRIYLGFLGWSGLNKTQMDNMCKAARHYYTTGKRLGWTILNGVENTLKYTPLLQVYSQDDMLHPNQEGVAELARNIAQAILSGYAENDRTRTITMTKSSWHTGSTTTFTVTELIKDDTIEFTVGDVGFVNANGAMTGIIDLGTCDPLTNSVIPYKYMNTALRFSGQSGTEWLGQLYWKNPTTLSFICNGTVPAGQVFNIKGLSATSLLSD